MTFAKGYRPDPAGHRSNGFHLLAASSAATTPPSVDLRASTPPVMNQDQCGSCTGHGTSCGTFTACATAGTPLPFVPSPRGIYTNGRAIDRSDPSIPLSDDGAMPNQIMRSITEWGVRPIKAPTSSGEYSDCEPSNVNREPTLAELTEEASTCFVGWYRISAIGKARTTQLRQALAAGHPVGVGTFVASSFENWQAGDPPVGHQNESDPNGGGHWTCCIGYETETSGATVFRIRNSWGASWGDNGDILVTESFMAQATDLYAFAATKAGS